MPKISWVSSSCADISQVPTTRKESKNTHEKPKKQIKLHSRSLLAALSVSFLPSLSLKLSSLTLLFLLIPYSYAYVPWYPLPFSVKIPKPLSSKSKRYFLLNSHVDLILSLLSLSLSLLPVFINSPPDLLSHHSLSFSLSSFAALFLAATEEGMAFVFSTNKIVAVFVLGFFTLNCFGGFGSADAQLLPDDEG